MLTADYVCCSAIHKEPSTSKSLLLAKDDPERYTPGLPVVSFHLTDEFRAKFPHVRQAAVSTLLRVKGWILPNYPLPPNEEKTEVLRAVIRESFSASSFPLPFYQFTLGPLNIMSNKDMFRRLDLTPLFLCLQDNLTGRYDR
jgi:hypothetical protein